MSKQAMSVMAVLVLVLGVMFQGCGGSEETAVDLAPSEDVGIVGNADAQDDGSQDAQNPDTPDTTPGSQLPSYVDHYYDSLFKYEDPTLYQTDGGVPYDKSDIVADECSQVIGYQMPGEALVISTAGNAIDLSLDGVTYTFPAVDQTQLGNYDMWGYFGDFKGYDCLVSLSSGVDTVAPYATLDMLGVGCLYNSNQNVCTTIYARDSEYDFSSETIKSVGNADGEGVAQFVNALKNAMLEHE
jgi:hypothetical protein